MGFEEEQKMLVPMAPYMWGWPAGQPLEAQNALPGFTYEDFTGGGALVLLKDGKRQSVSFSWNFEACPSGKVCVEGSDYLTFAELQAHTGGDLGATGVNGKELFPFLPQAFEHLTGT